MIDKTEWRRMRRIAGYKAWFIPIYLKYATLAYSHISGVTHAYCQERPLTQSSCGLGLHEKACATARGSRGLCTCGFELIGSPSPLSAAQPQVVRHGVTTIAPETDEKKRQGYRPAQNKLAVGYLAATKRGFKQARRKMGAMLLTPCFLSHTPFLPRCGQSSFSRTQLLSFWPPKSWLRNTGAPIPEFQNLFGCLVLCALHALKGGINVKWSAACRSWWCLVPEEKAARFSNKGLY